MSKAEVRGFCRSKFGKDWHKVHPLIKKARLQYAAIQLGYVSADKTTVRVTESGMRYSV